MLTGQLHVGTLGLMDGRARRDSLEPENQSWGMTPRGFPEQQPQPLARSRSPGHQAAPLLFSSSESHGAFQKVLFPLFLQDMSHHLTRDEEVPILMPPWLYPLPPTPQEEYPLRILKAKSSELSPGTIIWP